MSRPSRAQSGGQGQSTRPSANASANRPQRPAISTRQSSNVKDTEQPPFACPYSKHDPLRYSHCNISDSGEQEWRSCSAGLMRTISRLKQHLGRVHKDEMTDPQRRTVNERISGEPSHGWYTIYRILFPDDELPPTPWAEYVTGEHLRGLFSHIGRRLPHLLYAAACERSEFSGAPPALGRETRFPTTPQLIMQALIQCQKEFADKSDLSHVFARGSPDFSTSPITRIASTSRPRPQPNTDPRMTDGMRTFSADPSPSDGDSSDNSESDDLDDHAAIVTRDILERAQQTAYGPGFPVVTTMPMVEYNAPAPIYPTAYDEYMHPEYNYSEEPYRR